MTKIVFKLSALASLACMASFGLIFGVIAVLYGYDDYEETEVTTVETEIQEAENTEVYVSVECDLPVMSTSDSASVALNYATVWEVETDTVTSGESTLTAGSFYVGEDGQTYVANNMGLTITEEDYYCLLNIVYAEANDQGDKGMILVVNVILNRVKSSSFPNTIQNVVFSSGQFAPVEDGSYYTASPNEATIEAVNRALSGEDYSQGALYFCMSTSHALFSSVHTFLFQYLDHYFYY